MDPVAAPATSVAGADLAVAQPAASLFAYRLFGMDVSSAWPLPLSPAHSGSAVTIRPGRVVFEGRPIFGKRNGRPFGCWRTDHGAIVGQYGQFFDIQPECVIVDDPPDQGTVDLLVGSVASLLLSLRGLDPLHGAVVARDGMGLAILGPSGSGKSTATLGMVERGWDFVTDDLVVLDMDVQVQPGPPYLRLRADQVQSRPCRQDDLGRYHYTPPSITAGPVRLGAVIVHDDAYASPQRATGLEAARLLIGARYLPFEIVPGHFRRRLDTTLELRSCVPVYGAPPRSLTVSHIEAIAAESWKGKAS